MRSIPAQSKHATERQHAAPIEVKFSSDAGVIDGYASVFGIRDTYGDIVDAGAFAKSLQRHAANGTKPVMLAYHRMDRPCGVWDSLVEDQRGLKVAGRLNLDTQDGREILSLLKQRAVDGLSIGFQVPAGGATRGPDGARHLREIDLWEVSIVPIPANGPSRITNVKHADGVTSRREFEAFLQQAGFAKAAARRLAGGGWPALSRQDHEAAADLLRAVQKATQELKGTST